MTAFSKINVVIPVIAAALTSVISGVIVLYTTGLSAAPALIERVNLMDREISNLRKYQTERVNQSTAFFEHMPFPAWLKIKSGDTWRMANINNAYSKMYGISKLQYNGQTDSEVWGEELGQIYNDLDWGVYVSKEPMITREPVNEVGKPGLQLHIISKFPVQISDDVTAIAIGGISIPLRIVNSAIDRAAL